MRIFQQEKHPEDASWGRLGGTPLPHTYPSLLPVISKLSSEREEQRLQGETRDGNPRSWGRGTAATKQS